MAPRMMRGAAGSIDGVIYLDHNATTRPLEVVMAAARRAMEERWGNPSSAHRVGQMARREVELARGAVAGLIGAQAREIVFTSGGTESIDLAVRGSSGASGRRVLVTTRVEHEAVRGLAEELAKRGGVEVRWLELGRDGVVDVERARGVIDAGVGLVSVQWANNETGVVQPVGKIAELCRARGVVFHCDATQWVGKMPTDVGAMGVDLLTLSGHKFHGLKGCGALWVRRGVGLAARLHGTQELERRGGTENVVGIAALGAACEAAREWLRGAGARERLGAMRDGFEREVLDGVQGAVVNGAGAERLWNTTSIGFRGLEAEALLLMLSERGVCASAGAACSSGSLEPSPVLLAMGVEEEAAHGSVRFSLSRETTEDELREAAGIVVECAKRLGA